MTIRSRIEISNVWQTKEIADETRVVLYHRSDDEFGCYLRRMIAELQRMLERAEEGLAHRGAGDEAWNSQNVGAIVLEQADDGRLFDRSAYGSSDNDVPKMQYVWNVRLHREAGLYDIQCLKVVYDAPGQGVKRLVRGHE